MDAEKITTFGPDAEDFGPFPQSDELVLAPFDEPKPDAPREAARYGWTTGIMARFTQVLTCALGFYALQFEEEPSAMDEQTATPQREAQDTVNHRTKPSDDLERPKSRESQEQDELRALLDDLNTARKRITDLEEAAKVNQQQLDVLQTENASLEAQALQREREHAEAQARTRSLEDTLASAQDDIMQLKQKNSDLVSELKTAHADHITRTTSLENMIKSLNEQVFTLEHNAHSQRHHHVQTRSSAAQMDKNLLVFRAHYNVAQKQNVDIRQASAALAKENQVLRADNARLVASNTLAQQEVHRLQALASVHSRTVPQVSWVGSVVREVPAPGSSSFSFGMFGSVATSTVSVIASTPRSLFKAVMGSVAVGSDDDFTSPV